VSRLAIVRCTGEEAFGSAPCGKHGALLNFAEIVPEMARSVALKAKITGLLRSESGKSSVY